MIFVKKLTNEVELIMEDLLEGLVLAHPEYIKRLENHHVVVRTNKALDKVCLVSGGGSGHEPSHAGYVGEGMLDGAVLGDIFTSPTPDQVYEAIKAVDNGKGVLLVIKNYTGDVMNFEMAKEMAEMEGIKVEAVIVNDDVAVENSTYTAGRRGIAGTVFVHKIAGAFAESGASLEEVKEVAERVIENVRSMGVALSSCIVPAAGKANFKIGESELELGMGIHGEPGVRRVEMKHARDIVADMMHPILEDMTLVEGDEVAVLVNGLSGTPLMELYIMNRSIQQMLAERGIKVIKTLVGEYMTSLEMAGCSISLLKVDEQLKTLLHAKADAPAFKGL